MSIPKNGECHDSRGVPIHNGDLCRSYHFRDRRWGHRHLYHVACLEGEHLRMRPAQYLDPATKETGGGFLLTQSSADVLTVMSGHGPGDCLDFNDRKKVKRA